MNTKTTKTTQTAELCRLAAAKKATGATLEQRIAADRALRAAQAKQSAAIVSEFLK